MKKFLIIFLILSIIGPIFAGDIPRDSEGYYIWRAPGGNPRVHGGVFTRAEYTSWMLSEGGHNDLLRCGMPENLVKLARYLVQKGVNYPEFHEFSSGETGTVLGYTALAGSKYYQLTYADGQVITWVKLGFSGDAYSIQLKDKYGVVWVIDCFKRCANSGSPVNIVTLNFPVKQVPGAPPEIIQAPPEAPLYYVPKEVYVPKYVRAEQREVNYEGLLGGPLGKLLAAWLSAPRISFNPVMLGSKAYAFGGSPTAFGGAGGAGGNGGNGYGGAGYGGSSWAQGGSSTNTNTNWQTQNQAQSNTNIDNFTR